MPSQACTTTDRALFFASGPRRVWDLSLNSSFDQPYHPTLAITLAISITNSLGSTTTTRPVTRAISFTLAIDTTFNPISIPYCLNVHELAAFLGVEGRHSVCNYQSCGIGLAWFEMDKRDVFGLECCAYTPPLVIYTYKCTALQTVALRVKLEQMLDDESHGSVKSRY
jgi:hypothetical protein